ncbi:hypothetical protein HZR84_12530 [Hyphobacterium sp. CCMP332]|nr:hypothetical protein HZR84_12530 [Hyphobacterium sp. CCMP332]
MDGFDIVLYIGYALIVIAAAGSVILPLINSLGNPKSLIQSGIGIVALLVIFGISYALSGSEVTNVYSEFDVDESGSKTIGGLIIMMYMLIGLAVIGIVFTEVNKMLK